MSAKHWIAERISNPCSGRFHGVPLTRMGVYRRSLQAWGLMHKWQTCLRLACTCRVEVLDSSIGPEFRVSIPSRGYIGTAKHSFAHLVVTALAKASTPSRYQPCCLDFVLDGLVSFAIVLNSFLQVDPLAISCGIHVDMCYLLELLPVILSREGHRESEAIARQFTSPYCLHSKRGTYHNHYVW